ncbi:methyl-accepting chemotaxis protein [Erythrobacter sp. THAF29]|uniref:methyl-accepting chemotaxis protein n=1 Tax=Erythrobacter sp. THAF29 TaxID=2587851 RepID=UPI001268F0E8|nr:methyl-accepting chemotaxis protein [Erythrobacter sp. THAF29]
MILAYGWFVTALLILASAFYGGSLPLLALASAVLSVSQTILAVRRRVNRNTRSLIGAVAALQPALLSVGMIGTHWHTEAHMLFFVALMALIMLCDHRPILSATAIIILHDCATITGLLSVGAGERGSLFLASVHTVTIIVISAILCSITLALGHVMDKLESSRRKSEEQTVLLNEQAAELQQALHRVENERQAREQAEQERFAQRKADCLRFASEFEKSVANVIQSVSSTACVLEQTTKQLDRIAQENDERAAAYSVSAEAAAKAADRVARGVAELSESISKIAVTASQQEDLTARATERTASGGEAMGSLAEHSDTIEEATRAILRIADRTELLSLNAAIEAASAGPAGRGFTAVAQEVKALATQASDTASEIDAFLSGVRSGTRKADHSFSAINEAITALNAAARAIRCDVDQQRQSAGTIQDYARGAASAVQEMSERSKSLAHSAEITKKLSSELDDAATALLTNIHQLARVTERFSDRMKEAA